MKYNEALEAIGYKDKYENPGAILWSPGSLTNESCEFLCKGGSKKILDVGSGVGKFCLDGAHFNPKCHFTGVELDKDRHETALRVQEILTVNNATFICSNFTELDFAEYDGVFLFNPFNMGGHVVYNEGKALFYDYGGSNDEYVIKNNQIDQFKEEMNKLFIEKVSSMKVGSRVVISSTYIPLELTGLFKFIGSFDYSTSHFLKIK